MDKKGFITVTVLALLLAVSCEQEVPLAPAKSGTIDVFPNTLGRQWVYHVIDNLQELDPQKPDPQSDTVTVTISDFITDPGTGLEATVWRYFIPGKPPEARPVFFIGDTVYVYWNWDNQDRIGLIFPFEVRDGWKTGGLFSGDTTHVDSLVSLRVPAGLFSDVFILQNQKRTLSSIDKRIMRIWFVPNLGPIRIHLHEEHALSVGDTTWTLISHNFPGFD